MKSGSGPGRLYVCPVINTMGPVKDRPRHQDLLETWDDVDGAVSALFDDEYRFRHADSGGNPLRFSWFFINWSGFASNPVHRDFGWFTIYDHYRSRWGDAMRRFGDGMYWMYNHPAASGVGNEWGLDWLHNSHYLEILMRYVAERDYFPSVVQVVTEKNDASHFLENFFPFDLGNRNSVEVDWTALNADGKTMAEVIDWRRAPHAWEIFSPHEEDYQRHGNMRRKIGRLLDIKTILYQFKEYEFERAFQRCLEGEDAMVSAYEHDFRDRAGVVMERFIEPLQRVAARFPEVKWYYGNSLQGFQAMSGREPSPPNAFSARLDASGNLLILSEQRIFGTIPFTFLRDGDTYRYLSPLRVGERAWLIAGDLVQREGVLYVAANSADGVSTIGTFTITGADIRPGREGVLAQ